MNENGIHVGSAVVENSSDKLEKINRAELHTKIEEYLRKNHIKPIEARELAKRVSEACVDGRRRKGAIGTPGGNAGEFILMLTAQFGDKTANLSLDKIREYLENYLEINGRFYFHTDENAFGNLLQEVVKTYPKEEDKESLLEELTSSEHVGCGHLKKSLDFSEDYGVNSDFIKKVIKAIYLRMWDRNKKIKEASSLHERKIAEKGRKIDFQILTGKHKEKAVVVVKRVDKNGNELAALKLDDKVPMIPPHSHSISFFVSHPKAKGLLRDILTKEANKIFPDEKVDSEELLEKINALGKIQSAQTLARLAIIKKDGQEDHGFPVFFAVYDEDGKFMKLEDGGNVKTLAELESVGIR